MTVALICLSAALTGSLTALAATVVLFLRQQDREAQRAAQEREQHRREIASLHQARMEEVANLLQRIQAPEEAVNTHAQTHAPPTPVYPDMEDDDQLFVQYEKKLAALGMSE